MICSIDISNVLAFKKQWRQGNENLKAGDIKLNTPIHDAFHLDFCKGINVLIGENGVGKTSVLKMIYAATQWSVQQAEPEKTKKLLHFFSDHLHDNDLLKSCGKEKEYCAFKVSTETHAFEYSLSHGGIFNYDDWLGLNISSVFIPTTEMLSHSRSFLALNQKYNMPFDGTQVDIIVNASLPETKRITPVMTEALKKLSEVIDGTVIQKNDIFYVLKSDGQEVDFSLEAEGYRKLGLLWKLIRNGLLEAGSILLWDEPEANLNPELYPLVAEILVLLARNGVQIFLATHSYNFAKYLEIRRASPEQARFHNLYWDTTELPVGLDKTFPPESTGSAVYSRSAARLEDLANNHIMQADEKLLNEVYSLGGGT